MAAGQARNSVSMSLLSPFLISSLSVAEQRSCLRELDFQSSGKRASSDLS